MPGSRGSWTPLRARMGRRRTGARSRHDPRAPVRPRARGVRRRGWPRALDSGGLAARRTVMGLIDADAKFWAHVITDQPSGCWLWSGARCWGYGYFHAESRRPWVRAHRWTYERWIGPIPAGTELDHVCRTRAWVNPAHLEAVTPR